MKKLLLILLFASCIGVVFGQQTTETKLFPPQIKEGAENQVLTTKLGKTVWANLPSSAGDNWGSQVVVGNNQFTGAGTTASPLALVPANILTGSLNNNAGFITSPNDADANPSNEAQTLSKTGSTVTLTSVAGAAGSGGSFTDEVNDADASVTNEIQVLTRNPTNNVLTLTISGSQVFVLDDLKTDIYTPTTSTSTFTLTSAEINGFPLSTRVLRNGVEQTVTRTGTAADFTISGTTLTANFRAVEPGERVSVIYPR